MKPEGEVMTTTIRISEGVPTRKTSKYKPSHTYILSEEFLSKYKGRQPKWGFDGLELACWGDHFEVDKALAEDGYVQAKRELLEKFGLKCFSISTHLVGQCVCDDPIDERHKGILPARQPVDTDSPSENQPSAVAR